MYDGGCLGIKEVFYLFIRTVFKYLNSDLNTEFFDVNSWRELKTDGWDKVKLQKLEVKRNRKQR